MRTIDKKKNANEKVLKTFNLDKIVAEKLEAKCSREGTKASTFVNLVLREIVMDDLKWFESLRKEAALKINECDYMIDRIKAKKDTEK